MATTWSGRPSCGVSLTARAAEGAVAVAPRACPGGRQATLRAPEDNAFTVTRRGSGQGSG